MAAYGKNIQLYLMDGDASGRIKCSLANWTGVAYKIPRIELDKCKDREDLKQSGVYFLFGKSDETEKKVVYIGRAGARKNGEGILNRLMEHKRNPEKDYWTEAVVFTTSNNSLGPTEISYLENRFCNLAIEANRYEAKNGNDPNHGNITEEKESEMEEFIDYAKVIMGTLGHKVFELVKKPVAQKSDNSAPAVSDEIVNLHLERTIKNVGKVEANGSQTSEGQEGSGEVEQLLERKGIFDNPKPTRLLRSIIKVASDKDSIILDFFSDSATTAHAVMQLNAEDGGHRKFIMVQLPERTDEKSEAYKAGYRNICEIGKERIRRAGRKIKEEAGLAVPADLDIGFRCLHLDESNMDDVYYAPDELRQESLLSLVDNVKPDRSPEDLLFQVMLDLGILLLSPIERKEISGKKVFDAADGFLLACFDRDIRDETVKAIAKRKPYYTVFRDSGMANDSVAANFDQIFETYSPDTVRKVL